MNNSNQGIGLAGLQINSGIQGAATAGLLYSLQGQVNELWQALEFQNVGQVNTDVVYTMTDECGNNLDVVLSDAGPRYFDNDGDCCCRGRDFGDFF